MEFGFPEKSLILDDNAAGECRASSVEKQKGGEAQSWILNTVMTKRKLLRMLKRCA
jgi:hypothetical protein